MAVTLNASTSTGYIQTADTSGTLQLQSNGTTQQTIDSTGSYGQVKSGTVNAGGTNPFPSSSGPSSVDYTNIPSWVKRITVNFSGVSLSATANIVIQLGSGGTPKSSGYLGAFLTNTSAPAVSITALSSGFVFASSGASALHNGSIVFSLLNASSNTWSGFGIDAESSGSRVSSVSGSVALSATLDNVRITSSSTDLFDAGSINILYEG